MRWTALAPLLLCSNLSVVTGWKVALCFFGLTRSLELTIGNIRSSVIDPLIMADVNVSLYLHTYDLDAITNPRSAERTAAMNWTAYKLLQPDRLQIDNAETVERELITPNLRSWLRHGDVWERDSEEHVTFKNFLKQLHSLKEVTKLWMLESELPDIVFYLRSDIWFFNTLQTAELEQALFQNNTLFTPTFHRWGGLNDRLAFGHPSVMSAYGNRLDQALAYSKQEALHAERFLLHIANEAGLNHSGETTLLFERVRATGELWGIPSETAVPGDDYSTFHLRPGLKVQKGPLGNLEIVSL